MKRNDKMMSIGTLSNQSGVGIETIRYYEKIGLLKPVGRKVSGYRIFNTDSLKTLRFLRHAQELGFSLAEIKDLLKLKADKPSRCIEVKAKAEKHLKSVEEKLERLSQIKFVLTGLIGQCRQKKTEDHCPILECFEDCKYTSNETCNPEEKKKARLA